jgi:hypothetical protein
MLHIDATGGAYTGFRLVDGSQAAGKVLTSSADGSASWVTPSGGGGSIEVSDSAWSLLGNAGTDSTTNFIGTTDAQPILFKANNINRMKLRQDGALELYNLYQPSNTAIGQNTMKKAGSGSTAIGYSACFLRVLLPMIIPQLVLKHYAQIQLGDYNTAVGSAAMYYNTASSNTAVGYYALYTNSTGANNTGIGVEVLRANSTGARNVGVGIEPYN